jgi:hypothetical protein
LPEKSRAGQLMHPELAVVRDGGAIGGSRCGGHE